MWTEIEIICQKCMKIHDRDTNSPIQCQKCKKIVGCFWHTQGMREHRKTCKA